MTLLAIEQLALLLEVPVSMRHMIESNGRASFIRPSFEFWMPVLKGCELLLMANLTLIITHCHQVELGAMVLTMARRAGDFTVDIGRTGTHDEALSDFLSGLLRHCRKNFLRQSMD